MTRSYPGRMWYKLEGKTAVPCADLNEAAWHFSNDDRTVRVTESELHAVSTVFLGLDHNHLENGPPLLFETQVFERHETREVKERIHYEGDIGILARYPTWEEAELGHERILGDVLRLERAALTAANFHRKPVINE